MFLGSDQPLRCRMGEGRGWSQSPRRSQQQGGKGQGEEDVERIVEVESQQDKVTPGES